jgi:predicted Zn finger-like uncharacterized protein
MPTINSSCPECAAVVAIPTSAFGKSVRCPKCKHAFYWQSGYGAFSVSPREMDIVTAYIANQEEHHKAETYQDELRRVLTEYRIDYDERYLWD